MRACVFLVGFWLSVPAFADSPAPVRVLLRGCDGLGETEVERVLSAELGADTQPTDSTEPTWIVARCEAGRVIIEVSDPVSRKTLRRTFHLGTARAEARARLIGIAASELVLASWAELAILPALRVEPEGRAPDPTRAAAAVRRVREAPEERDPERPQADFTGASRPAEPVDRDEKKARWSERTTERLRLLAIASGRAFLEHDGALFGGGVRLGDEPLARVSWALDALFEAGSLDTNSDNLDVETWTLGAMVYFYGRARVVTARVGAGLRVGLATTSDPDSHVTRAITPWGWPMLALSTTLRLGSSAVLELSGESSYVALPAFSGALGASISGIWVCGQVGLGASP